MKNLNLKQKTLFIFTFMVLVMVVSGFVIFHSLSMAKKDANITNVLGRQRMLSQAMGKAALGSAMAKSRRRTIEQQVASLDRYITQMRAVYTKSVITAAKDVNLEISINFDKEHKPAIPFPATLTRIVNQKFGQGRDFTIEIISEDPMNPKQILKTDLDREANEFLKTNR